MVIRTIQITIKSKINPFLLIAFFIAYSNISCGQNNVDLSLYLNNYLNQINGLPINSFVEPNSSQQIDFEKITEYLIQQNIQKADSIANTLNYKAYEVYDTVSSSNYYILEEKYPSMFYWGTLVINPTACRNKIIIQATHPIKDYNTGKQAIYTFLNSNTYGLIISGTDRCNHDTLSNCDGTTTVCNGLSSPYPISDVAHNNETIFHKITETILNEVNECVFIQLHGFTKTTNDPYLIASNGNNETPPNTYLVDLANHLNSIDPSINYVIPHIDTNWNRLIGSTNVQGRMINGSINECYIAASNNSGRFIHLEQEKTKLRDNQSGWDKLNQAIKNTFPCTNNIIEDNSEDYIKIYPNPTNQIIYITSNKNIKKVTLFDHMGNEVFHGNNKKEIDISNLKKGIYIAIIGSEDQTYKKKIIKL